jgi:UDP-3-O-[3-hydroxymyristoyl] glucosamine N-acyltransferase
MSSQPTFTLKQLQERFGGVIKGNEEEKIIGVGTVQSAVSGQIAFVDNPKYQGFIANSKASVIILSPAMNTSQRTVWVVDNPKLIFAQVVELFFPPQKAPLGIHPTAVIGEDCVVGQNVSIGPFCVIGDRVVIEEGVTIESHSVVGADCSIGKNTYLHARVTLYHRVRLGGHCRVHSGTILGSDGFGFAQQSGQWHKVPQVGGVCIGDHVEIGANTTIDRGTLEDTVIGDWVIMDNLIQVGHNVRIGKGTAIAACVGIAGSCTIGAHCMIGGASMINGHIHIADHSYFIPGSQVANSIKKPGVYSSAIPAKERSVWAKNVARFHQLDVLAHKVKKLQQMLQPNSGVTEETEA